MQAQAQAQPQPQPSVNVSEETVNDLIAISGKPKEQCVQALQAAYGDPDRAFQYLMDGIPQMVGGGNPMGGMPPGMPPGMMDGDADMGDGG